MSKIHTETYQGEIRHYSNGEEDEIISLSALDDPLAQEIEEDMDAHGKYLTVRYYISEQELSEERLLEEYLKTIFGIGKVEYHVAYSEITGYLWTDEELQVGGHDLLEELQSHVGKWLHLQIDYSREAPTAS